MTAMILDILAVIFGVLIAPLCVIGIVQPRTRMGHLARVGAGVSIVLFFLVVWGNTGRDPLQWSYCFVARSAHSCRDIAWNPRSPPAPDTKSDVLSNQAAPHTPVEASLLGRGTGGDRQFAPGLTLGAVKTIVPLDLQAAGFLANGSGLNSTSDPIAIVQGLWASFTPGEVVRPCRQSDSMHGNSVKGTALRYFQVHDGRFVGGGQQLIRRVDGKMLVMDGGIWGIRIINQDRIESVDFNDGSIGYIAIRCR
jgi:hypothetical protein